MPFSYTISSANTWTYITVAITAPTATGGTNTGNTAGVYVRFGLGAAGTASGGTAGTWTNASNYLQPSGTVNVVGTNGATFYITGVQLEKGSTATSFDYRPYGTELALCQRYYEVLMKTDSGDANRPAAVVALTSTIFFNILYKVNKRTSSPTVTFTAGEVYSGGWSAFTSPTVTGANDIAAQFEGTKSGLTVNSAYIVKNAGITVSAEL